MKIRSSSGFTLIELLVVISIIAILASMSFAGITSAVLQAHKLRAKNDMVQIKSAIQSYYAEYGRYPTGGDTTGKDMVFGYGGDMDNSAIISMLRHRVSDDGLDPNNENPRELPFIEPKVVQGAGATVKGAVDSDDGNWYDPWGEQYIIFIDSNYDGDISNAVGTIFSNAGTVNTSIGVASLGLFNAKAPPSADPDLSTVEGKKWVLLSW